MIEPLVRLTIENGVAQVTLNRPAKRNALTRTVIAQLAAAVAATDADASSRLLILGAEGPAFCAGMDLEEMQLRASQPNAAEEWEKDTRVYHDLVLAILRLRVPTLAVVQGSAMAGGLGLALACDLVLASTSARFALPEPKRGITAAVVLPMLVHRVGAGAATPILLSGQTVSAEEAYRVGLCHYLALPDKLDDVRSDLATSILSGAPQALAATKKLLWACTATSLVEQLNAGMSVSARARQTAEAREGLASFLEKRTPSWALRTTAE